MIRLRLVPSGADSFRDSCERVENDPGAARAEDRHPERTDTGGDAHRGGQPDAGSGGEPFDFFTLRQLENGAGADESDAGGDALDDTRQFASGETSLAGGDDEERAPERHQHV